MVILSTIFLLSSLTMPTNYYQNLTDIQVDNLLDELGWELEALNPNDATDKPRCDVIWDEIEALRILSE